MSRLPRPCRKCGVPAAHGLCERCGQAQSRSRGSRQSRGYDALYDRNSRAIRAAHAIHGSTCVRCGLGIPASESITVDHIRAKRDGGTSELANLGPAHARCNYGHGGRIASRRSDR